MRARKVLAEEQYGEAVAELGVLLSAQDDVEVGPFTDIRQDFFLSPDVQTGVRTSLKAEAQRLLGSMPERGRELYELQFGADARALLEEAAASADVDKLTDVTRRYFHTEAGYEATLLLGRLHLDRGRALAAAMCLERLAAAPIAARKYDPELSLLLSTCWLYSDYPDRAGNVLQNLSARFPDVAIEIGGREIGKLPPAGESLDWLQRHFGGWRGAMPESTPQWVMFRGNAARNASTVGGMPLVSHRWTVPTGADQNDTRLIRELRRDHSEQRFPLLPSLQPLAVGDIVLMRTPDRLLALEFDSGKRVWEYPWWDTSYDDIALATRPGARSDEVSNRKQKLLQRLWQDNAYGQVASDGRSVFVLDELRYAGESKRPQFMPRNAGGLRMQNPEWPRSHNKLVALDLARQGSLRWEVGGESGHAEPELAGAFFLGAPLPLSGQLYVLVELNAEVRLVVLDAETGEQSWSQQLAHVDKDSVLSNVSRRLAGLTPSFAEGVLICPTAAGAVVAVNVATRSLLWGHQYQAPRNRQGNVVYPSRNRGSRAPWADASATIADGSVLLTPVESDSLVCLDLVTGKPRWEPLSRRNQLNDMLFIASVHDGKAILVGKHEVLAVNLADGTLPWEEPVSLNVDTGEMPSGRGFQSGNSYYLPTTTSHLIKIDLDRGQMTERVKTSDVLGNLICYRDQVLSHGADSMSTFYHVQPLRELVKQRLADNADDAWALARHGELLVHDGRNGDALDPLMRSLALDETDDAVRVLLVDTFLAALREDFAKYRDRAEDIAPLIESREQRTQYLQLVAIGMHGVGELADARDAIMELSTLVPERRSTLNDTGPAMVEVEPGWSVRLDRWTQARLERLHAEGDAALREQLDREIQQQLDDLANVSIDALRHRLSLFGFHPACDRVRLELADRLVELDRTLEAEQLLASLIDSESHEQQGAAMARLAALYSQVGKKSVAARFYRQLGDTWAETTCFQGKTGRQLLDEAKGRPELKDAFGSSGSWADGHAITTQKKGRSSIHSSTRMQPLRVKMRSGPHAPAVQVAFDTRYNAIELRNGLGQETHQVSLPKSQQNGRDAAFQLGHLCLVYFGAEVMALDTFKSGDDTDDAVVWRADLLRSLPAMGSVSVMVPDDTELNPFAPSQRERATMRDGAGRPVSSMGPVTSHGVVYQRLRTLVCVDPLTGETIWSRDGIPQGTTLFGDDEYLFVLPEGEAEVSVFRTADGFAVGTRPVPPRSRHWATPGRRVLAWEPVDGGTRLYLRDVWSEADVWSETFAAGAAGTVHLNRHVAVMEPGGRFVLRSLSDDSIAINTTVAPQPELQSIRLLETSESYLLLSNTNRNNSQTRARNVQPIHNPVAAPMLYGRIDAFDRVTGQPLWPVGAEIRDFGLPVQQPADSPALWFIRHFTTPASRTAPRPSNQASVLCIDKRDGRILYSNDDIPTQANTFKIDADGEKMTSTLVLPGYSYTVQFTSDPTPPAPPAQTGDASSQSTTLDMNDDPFDTSGDEPVDPFR